ASNKRRREQMDSNEKQIDKIVSASTAADELVRLSNRDWWSVGQRDVDAFQLRLMRQRFSELRPNVVMLDKLATLQGVDTIESIDDVVPLLFQHTAYKSYPMSLLEKGRFRQL